MVSAYMLVRECPNDFFECPPGSANLAPRNKVEGVGPRGLEAREGHTRGRRARHQLEKLRSALVSADALLRKEGDDSFVCSPRLGSLAQGGGRCPGGPVTFRSPSRASLKGVSAFASASPPTQTRSKEATRTSSTPPEWLAGPLQRRGGHPETLRGTCGACRQAQSVATCVCDL